MRKSRFSEGLIIANLKQRQARIALAATCRKRGISDATRYDRRSTYGRMELSDARRLKALEDENRRRETRYPTRTTHGDIPSGLSPPASSPNGRLPFCNLLYFASGQLPSAIGRNALSAGIVATIL